jgi:predicted DCC family thiol-disulfide oxidoreductase YuxK
MYITTMNINNIEEILKEHAIVIFDGECNLCDSSVKFIINRDTKAYFKFTPQQSPIAQQILIKEYGNNLPDSVVLVNQQGIYNHFGAVLRIATKLNGFWKIFAIFRIIPVFLINPFYKLLARFRKKLFGAKEVCLLPSPERAERFIKADL